MIIKIIFNSIIVVSDLNNGKNIMFINREKVMNRWRVFLKKKVFALFKDAVYLVGPFCPFSAKRHQLMAHDFYRFWVIFTPFENYALFKKEDFFPADFRPKACTWFWSKWAISTPFHQLSDCLWRMRILSFLVIFKGTILKLAVLRLVKTVSGIKLLKETVTKLWFPSFIVYCLTFRHQYCGVSVKVRYCTGSYRLRDVFYYFIIIVPCFCL